MSKRAEEAALKRFPEEMTRIPYQDLIEAFGGKEYVDFNSMPRGYFQLGYEQAEKDIKDYLLEWLNERYKSTISNVGCYTGHSVWAEVIEKLESM